MLNVSESLKDLQLIHGHFTTISGHFSTCYLLRRNIGYRFAKVSYDDFEKKTAFILSKRLFFHNSLVISWAIADYGHTMAKFLILCFVSIFVHKTISTKAKYVWFSQLTVDSTQFTQNGVRQCRKTRTWAVYFLGKLIFVSIWNIDIHLVNIPILQSCAY